MPESLEETLRKCDKQLEGLFIYLGSIVCDKAARGEIHIQFDPAEQGFCDELEELFGKIQALDPKPQAAPVPNPASRRGALSPYVDLNVKLHEAKKKFVAIREDVDSCLSLASLHLESENRAKADQFLDRLGKTENTINTLFEKIAGSIRQIMDVKNKSMDKAGAETRPVISNDEKKFLHSADLQVQVMTKGVETLFDEAIALFEGIKLFYEKDAEKRAAQKAKAPAVEKLSDEKASPEEVPEPDDEVVAPEVEGEDEPEIEEPEANEQEAAPEEEETAEEDSASQEGAAAEEQAYGAGNAGEADAGGTAHETAAFDDALMRSAERKLLSQSTDKKERFHILMTLFRSVEAGAMVDFLMGFFERAPVITKIEVLDLVTEVEHPGLEQVYKRFMVSPESLFRYKGLVGFCKLHPESMSSLMMHAADDAEAPIRRLAANCIRPEDGDAEFGTIVNLSNDKDDSVARVAIRRLVNCKSSFVISSLIPKLRHANVKIRKETIGILKIMTGKDFGYRINAPEKERNVAVKAWEKFSAKNHSPASSVRESKQSARRHS